MKLYCHPASITSRPVRLYIAEKGLKVQEEIVDLFTGAHHSPEYIAINPSRLVPVLEDGDFRLTEHGAILKYLAESNDFPEYPKDLKRRARGITPAWKGNNLCGRARILSKDPRQKMVCNLHIHPIDGRK